MYHIRSLLFVFLILFAGCKPAFYHQITTAELKQTISYLASDSLKGRLPGTVEDSLLTDFISNQFDISGLRPIGENGLQQVEVESGYTVLGTSQISFNNEIDFAYGEDLYTIEGFSANGLFTGELILANAVDNFTLNTSEEFILAMPYPENLPPHDYDAFSSLRSLGLAASDLGASGLILYTGNDARYIDHDKRNPLSIPVLSVSSSALKQTLEKLGRSIEAGNLQALAKSRPFKTGIVAKIESDIESNMLTTNNVLYELVGGNSKLSGEYLIIGAHHDHLGMGGRGTSSRHQDTVGVHYGADDNASGVAGVIELAQQMMSRSPSRSFIFTTFAAEEMGLFGSKKLAADPPVDLENVQLMINLDMIGRLNENRQLQIGGVGTSPSLRPVLDSINTTYNFDIAYSEAGYGPSDHSSFYAKNVPVIFISTGAHTDYHTPDDTENKINYTGMQEVLSYIADVTYAFSELPGKIKFTESGPKESSGSRGRAGMVTFGLMPDVMYDGNEGMPVSFVTEGKPAAIAGMKGGDIIQAVDGKSVGNVQDYMERLSELKEGQSVIVTVEREGTQLELLIKL